MKHWASKVRKALGEGREGYKLAADTIAAQMRSDPKLTQKSVAQAIDRSATWVCRLLQWHKDGCREETVFGTEMAVRRQKIATSQFDGQRWVNGKLMQDGEYKQPWLGTGTCVIDASPIEPANDQGEDCLKVALRVQAVCLKLEKEAPMITSKMLLAGDRLKHDGKYQTILKALSRELGKTSAVIEVALSEVCEALKILARKGTGKDAAWLRGADKRSGR